MLLMWKFSSQPRCGTRGNFPEGKIFLFLPSLSHIGGGREAPPKELINTSGQLQLYQTIHEVKHGACWVWLNARHGLILGLHILVGLRSPAFSWPALLKKQGGTVRGCFMRFDLKLPRCSEMSWYLTGTISEYSLYRFEGQPVHTAGILGVRN